jgi:hypothetical protein
VLEIPFAGKGIPFMLAGIAGGIAGDKINKTRIVEAVIIGIMVGAITFMGGKYVALPAIEQKLEYFIQDGKETRQMLIDLRREIQRDIADGRVRRDAQQTVLEAKIVAMQIELAKRRH